MLDFLKRLFPRVVKQAGPIVTYDGCVEAFERKLLQQEFGGNVLKLKKYQESAEYRQRRSDCEADCRKKFGDGSK